MPKANIDNMTIDEKRELAVTLSAVTGGDYWYIDDEAEGQHLADNIQFGDEEEITPRHAIGLLKDCISKAEKAKALFSKYL